jgi:hypothetical protein
VQGLLGQLYLKKGDLEKGIEALNRSLADLLAGGAAGRRSS